MYPVVWSPSFEWHSQFLSTVQWPPLVHVCPKTTAKPKLKQMVLSLPPHCVIPSTKCPPSVGNQPLVPASFALIVPLNQMTHACRRLDDSFISFRSPRLLTELCSRGRRVLLPSNPSSALTSSPSSVADSDTSGATRPVPPGLAAANVELQAASRHEILFLGTLGRG